VNLCSTLTPYWIYCLLFTRNNTACELRHDSSILTWTSINTWSPQLCTFSLSRAFRRPVKWITTRLGFRGLHLHLVTSLAFTASSARAPRWLVIMTMARLGLCGVTSVHFLLIYFYLLHPSVLPVQTSTNTSYIHKHTQVLTLILGFEHQICYDFMAHHP